MQSRPDEFYMRMALELAKEAASLGEIPVGAVVVRGGEVIGSGCNRRETDADPAAHAELLALRNAAETLGDWRLGDCTLYVTLEPCAMCTGAVINARVGRVVYGAAEPQTGCCGSVCNLLAMPFSHCPVLTAGVLQEECAALLAAFFAGRRKPEELR